jgi:hypothetical protein
MKLVGVACLQQTALNVMAITSILHNKWDVFQCGVDAQAILNAVDTLNA